MTSKQIDNWFKKSVGKDKVKAGVQTFTAMEVLNILINFNFIKWYNEQKTMKQKFATPYKYAKLCGVKPQAIYQRIASGSLEVVTMTDINGEERSVIDLKKFPPSKGRKKVKNNLT